jgi:sarcosine oxidase gamma subunit
VDAAAADVSGGLIAASHIRGDEARVTLQQGSEADLRLAGCWFGRAPSRLAQDQRDRSAQ